MPPASPPVPSGPVPPADAAPPVAPVHPGEVLVADFLAPLGLTTDDLATAAGLPAAFVAGVAAGSQAVTASAALRLGRVFGTSPRFWLNLQTSFDLAVAADLAGPALDRIVPLADARLSS
jgi:addiction module HigA family antidote